MRIAIHSWNAQGNFRGKSSCLNGMLCKHIPNIILLQEEGSIGASKNTGFNRQESFFIGYSVFECAIAHTDPTAKSLRCTTAIAVEWPYIKPNQCDVVTLEIARPLCFIDLGFLWIGTLHAIADSRYSVVEVKEHLRNLVSFQAETGKDWILMGDFNSNPWDYDIMQKQTKKPFIFNESHTIAFAETTSETFLCNVIADSRPTQGAGGVRDHYLDFAFHNTNQRFRVIEISNNMIRDNDGDPVSDHNLITVIIDIDRCMN